MFDLEILVVADDAAKRATKTKRAAKAKRGRGAPGKPKSSAHRKAISASLKRYWGSKRAAHRRRSGGKRKTGNKRGGNGGRAKTSTSTKTKATRRARTKTPKAPAGTVNAPRTSKPPKPKNHTATGAQVHAAASRPRRASLTGARRRDDTRRFLNS